ncbi:interleukin-1 receptor-associated kinase 1-binding protein 1 [Ambystoma mexicanum]|uniref:interleukin-1 receptor-associated kinase 1-binding protein 1 n=1 Tax=Ambystoma mexicanum TaxID=8296 RepID=UPI0037E88AB2
MSYVRPVPVSRVFAALCPQETEQGERSPRIYQHMENQENQPSSCPRGTVPREVHVSGVAELSAPPDRAQVSVQLNSSKDTAADAKNSVNRRLEYILQCLRQHGVKDEQRTVTKNFRRRDNTYNMEAEVCVTFDDFERMQTVCNLLVEKLDMSVSISSPNFYHTPESVESLRRQVCLAAVGNARRKAQEVCRLVGQALGKPLLLKEEELKELEYQGDNYQDAMSIQQKIKSKTISAASKVFATFEIKGKEKNKKHV